MATLGTKEYNAEEMEEIIPKTNGYQHTENQESLYDSSPVIQQTEKGTGAKVELHYPVKPSPVDYSHLITVITAWNDILNARLLAVLSLIGTLAGFGFVMYDPTSLRLWGLAVYAVLCQGPVLALYLRKG